MAMNLGSFASRVVATRVVALDGTGDFTDIQSAINDLPSGGGVVYVKEGTYTLTSALTVTSNISIIGSGTSTIVIPPNGSGGIHGFSSGITIDKCYFKNTASNTDGVYFKNGSFCKIFNCWFEMGRNGVRFENMDNCEVSNCRFFNSGRGIFLGNCNYCFITNNHFDAGDSAVMLYKGDYNIISNNFVTSTTFGIWLYPYPSGTGQETDYNVVIGNVSISNSYGIRIETSDGHNNSLIGNICYNNSSANISDSGTNTLLSGNYAP